MGGVGLKLEDLGVQEDIKVVTKSKTSTETSGI
jgi:hypothetical protein